MNKDQEAVEKLKKRFERHAIIKESHDPSVPLDFFYVRGPDHSAYWFQVVCTPKTIVISGDCGEMIFAPYAANSLQWLRESVNSIDYMFKKVPSGMLPMEYSPEMAKEAVEYHLSCFGDGDDLRQVKYEAEELIDEIDSNDWTEHDFYKAALETQLFSGCDLPTVTQPAVQAYLRLAALQCLCRLLDERNTKEKSNV